MKRSEIRGCPVDIPIPDCAEFIIGRAFERPVGSIRATTPLHLNTAASLSLSLSLRLHRFHPPREIVGEAWERVLQRFAALADRLAFRGKQVARRAD